MLDKQHRLRTKDVLFLTKKRQYFWSWLFWFFYVVQYPNLKYNQISFHVSIKYNKHATARNIIKRAIINYVQAKDIESTPIWDKFYKIFITLNKSKIEELQKKFANMDKKHIITSVQEMFTNSFTALSKALWKSSKI